MGGIVMQPIYNSYVTEEMARRTSLIPRGNFYLNGGLMMWMVFVMDSQQLN